MSYYYTIDEIIRNDYGITISKNVGSFETRNDAEIEIKKLKAKTGKNYRIFNFPIL